MFQAAKSQCTPGGRGGGLLADTSRFFVSMQLHRIDAVSSRACLSNMLLVLTFTSCLKQDKTEIACSDERTYASRFSVGS